MNKCTNKLNNHYFLKIQKRILQSNVYEKYTSKFDRVKNILK